MIKFGIKVGIAAGAVYYLNEQGVWKDSEETQKIYGKLNTIASPYVKQVTEQLPFEIPPLPSSERVSYLTKQYWNRGVMTTFEYLSNLPDTVSNWTKKGFEAVYENPEVKKFLDSFSAVKTLPASENKETKK